MGPDDATQRRTVRASGYRHRDIIAGHAPVPS